MSSVTEARCAYCAEPVTSPEGEHVFPESWYPDDTSGLHMLRVPSCSSCNRRLGAIEERLVRSLIMGVHPRNPMASGVQRRVFNGMNWLRAKGKTELAREKDERARKGSWKKLKGRTKVIPTGGALDAFPTAHQPKPYLLRNEAGLWVKGMGTVSFDHVDLHAITEKFVRGVYYLKMGTPLPSIVPIHTHPITGETAHKVITSMRWPRQGIHLSFVYWGNVATEDSLSSFWLFRLWNEYLLAGTTNQVALANMENTESPSL